MKNEPYSIIRLHNYCLDAGKTAIIHKGKLVGFRNELWV